MLSRFCLVAFSILLVFPVYASTGLKDVLSEALDEFNYIVHVEWDQQDSRFYAAQVDKLKAKIIELRQLGLADRELWEVALKSHQNQRLAAELESVYRLFEAGELSGDVAQGLLLQLAQDDQDGGASWAGGQSASEIFNFFFLTVYVLTSGTCAPTDPQPAQFNSN